MGHHELWLSRGSRLPELGAIGRPSFAGCRLLRNPELVALKFAHDRLPTVSGPHPLTYCSVSSFLASSRLDVHFLIPFTSSQ